MYYRDQLTVSCVFELFSVKIYDFDNLSHKLMIYIINNPFFRFKNNIKYKI